MSSDVTPDQLPFVDYDEFLVVPLCGHTLVLRVECFVCWSGTSKQCDKVRDIPFSV